QPALLTRISTAPSSRWVRATASRTASPWVTSISTATQRPPAAVTRSAASWAAARRRSATATALPSAARAAATAAPMPPPPPVTSATRPDTRRSLHVCQTTDQETAHERAHRCPLRGRARARVDHDRPSRAHERLPRADGRRADPLPQARVVEPGRGGRLPDRLRGPRVLYGGRPEAARRERRLRAVRVGSVRGRDAPPADPRGAEAGRGRRERVRDRRRARAARPVRPHHRGGHRGVRAERAARRIVRCRLRHRLPGTSRGREARPRDLDALPAL